MIEDIDKKLSDTSKFIVTKNFKWLTKTNFNARLTKYLKNLATKNYVENALDWRNKSKNKKLMFKFFYWWKLLWWWWIIKVFNISTSFYVFSSFK